MLGNGETSESSEHDGPPKAILEAIGSIILNQGYMDTALFAILTSYLHLPIDISGPLFDSLNNRARVDLVALLAQAEDHLDDEREALAFALRCFDICIENRNVMAHCAYVERQEGQYIFFKNPTSASTNGWYFGATEVEFSSAANQARKFSEYLAELWGALRRRPLNGPDMPLPERPLQPRKLSLLQLPKDHPIYGPPPES
jgi:hypothetical protein